MIDPFSLVVGMVCAPFSLGYAVVFAYVLLGSGMVVAPFSIGFGMVLAYLLLAFGMVFPPVFLVLV